MIAFTHSRRSTDRSFVRGSTILDGCKLPRAIGRCFGGLERREFDCRGDVVVARARGCSAASLVFLLPLDEKKSEGVIVLSAKTRANAIPRGMRGCTDRSRRACPAVAVAWRIGVGGGGGVRGLRRRVGCARRRARCRGVGCQGGREARQAKTESTYRTLDRSRRCCPLDENKAERGTRSASRSRTLKCVFNTMAALRKNLPNLFRSV